MNPSSMYRNDDFVAGARVKLSDILKCADAIEYVTIKMDNWHGDLVESYMRVLLTKTASNLRQSYGFLQPVTMWKHVVDGSDDTKIRVFNTMPPIEQLFRLQEVEVTGMGGPGFTSMRSINMAGSITMGCPPMHVKPVREGSRNGHGYVQTVSVGLNTWVLPNTRGTDFRPSNTLPMAVSGVLGEISRTTWPIPPPYDDCKGYARNHISPMPLTCPNIILFCA